MVNAKLRAWYSQGSSGVQSSHNRPVAVKKGRKNTSSVGLKTARQKSSPKARYFPTYRKFSAKKYAPNAGKVIVSTTRPPTATRTALSRQCPALSRGVVGGEPTASRGPRDPGRRLAGAAVRGAHAGGGAEPAAERSRTVASARWRGRPGPRVGCLPL